MEYPGADIRQVMSVGSGTHALVALSPTSVPSHARST